MNLLRRPSTCFTLAMLLYAASLAVMLYLYNSMDLAR